MADASSSTIGPLFISVYGLKSVELPRAARTILCLHGVEAHGARYAALAARLPEATIVAPDLRGHGRSPKHGPWTVEQHVRDLLPLTRRLGPRVIVLGHSYGGLLAWELAREAHDQLAGLVLVDPAIAVADYVVRDGAANSLIGHHWPDAPSAFQDMAEGRGAEAHWSVALDVAIGLQRGDDGALREVAAPEAVGAAWQHMAARLRPTSWRGPTLLLEAGRENGRFVSPWLIKALQEQLGDRLEHIVLDAPHTITADSPDLLAEHVREFVEGLLPR